MNKLALNILFAVLLLLSAVALVHIFTLRFEQGDVYPPYSTFRADPIGTRGFYEALERIPGMRVERNLGDIESLELSPETVLIVPGAIDSPDPQSLLEKLEGFMEAGGRLVITLRPEQRQSYFFIESEGEIPPPWPFDSDSNKDSTQDEDGEEDAVKNENSPEQKNNNSAQTDADDKDTSDPEDFFGMKLDNIKDRWDFEIKSTSFPAKQMDGDPVFAQKTGADHALPENVAWFSPYYFKPKHKEWQTVYSRMSVAVEEEDSGKTSGKPGNNKKSATPKTTQIMDIPVVMRRTWGAGDIILCSDTYFMTNEAIQKHRYPELLTWIIGPHKNAVFNETHIGVMKQTGMIDFIRHYRLTGLLLVGIVSGLLFIWKNGSSLVPRRDRSFETYEGRVAHGRDISDGLGALLKRCIPPNQLIKVCEEEYKAAFRHDPILQMHMKDLFPATTSGVPESEIPRYYSTLSKRIKERKFGRHE